MSDSPQALAADSRRALIAGTLLTVAVFVVGLTWAKWLPYTHKALAAAQNHHWSGSDIMGVGGVHAGDAPSWHAATTFFHAYTASIWPALVVALLLSACVQAFVPRDWLPLVLNRRRLLPSAVAGGLASMPSMMCTCCSAPVAATLRRAGVNNAAAVAYWLGNPLLNPAVLVFLCLVAPWQWTLTRLSVGVAAVVSGSALVAVITRRRGEASARDDDDVVAIGGTDDRGPAAKFTAALLRMGLILLPEYAVLVLLIGAGRGWLLTLLEPSRLGLLLVVIAAVVGTLMVIPTAGEIPILQALALLGASSGVVGALLITLPAVSLPGAAMVARSFGWRATAATAVVVMAAGLLGGAVLTLL
ncbi:permease [Mycolicibacterium agri]|uniref:Permease n=1 Tax=Mycolicibacterium agri TaxID=36811 RepID=A0A2A7N6M0_MYCAG|nr:permease [Mycolicibacterium agri]PEG39534.1 permease [Mycolicibacterium agri]GFG48628.1 hypothetical protein MAGR_00690 [Mycolicibacterium agri]